MARVCTVCSHPDRAEIDTALANDAANRRIASQFGLSEAAVRRHRADHLPARLVKAAEDADIATAIDIVAQMRDINVAVRTVLKQASKDGDGELVLKSSDRILRQLELQAKLLGALPDGDTVNINVTINAAWTSIRTVMLAALAEYPDARVAIDDALEALDDGTGHHTA